VIVRSVHEDEQKEVPDAAVAKESKATISASSVDVVEMPASTSCDPEIVPSGNNLVSTSSCSDANTVPKTYDLQHVNRPHASIAASSSVDVVEIPASTSCDPVIVPSGNNHVSTSSRSDANTVPKTYDLQRVNRPHASIVASSSVDVVEMPASTSCDPEIVLSGNNHVSTSSRSDANTVPKTYDLQHVNRPHASVVTVGEMESLQVLSKSGDARSPSGLVAFCQSETSAFTSVITPKHATTPVVVDGCEQRLRGSCSARSSRSSLSHCASPAVQASHDTSAARENGYPVAGDDESSHSAHSSHTDDNSPELSCESDEPAQIYAESPVLECDVASSCVQNSQSVPAVRENLMYDPSAICVNSAQAVGSCNEAFVPCYPQCVRAPVPRLPPPCYCSPVPAMTPSYPQSMYPYMTPMPPCYPPGVSILSYPVMSPPGMMPAAPVGMMSVAYPPFAPCYFPPVMCRPRPMPLPAPPQPVPFPTPMQPLPYGHIGL